MFIGDLAILEILCQRTFFRLLKGWRITSALHRIWAGERDWHALVEELNAAQALLVLRVLETLEEMK